MYTGIPVILSIEILVNTNSATLKNEKLKLCKTGID